MTGHRGSHSQHDGIRAAMKIGAIALTAGAALAASLPLAAHHSFAAEFDSTREIKITGSVADVEWQNPHAWIHVDALEVCERPAAPRGSDEPAASWTCATHDANEAPDWGFELGSPNGLMRLGWNRNTLGLGDTITVEGSRARDDSNNGNARSVTTADGTRLFAGSSERSTP
jgi:Family of unknown function (DUF6152)